MVVDITTGFVGRLRARDPDAWFELWETFGPVIRSQLHRWGRGHIGFETVQDLSQETLTALASAIDTHDPSRGVRFSTWLLAIARYTLTDEFDRRNAQKRGSGRKPAELEAAAGKGDDQAGPDEVYATAIFGAKVDRALKLVERESEFVDFEVFRMRVLDGLPGKRVAGDLGLSEAGVSRRLNRIRVALRARLGEVMERFSFTEEEMAEAGRKGLDPNPKKVQDALFDEALAEVFHRYSAFRSEADGPEGGSTR